MTGGTSAITSDFTTVLSDALPIFLAIVIGLGFLALVLLFHSIVVPLTAAVIIDAFVIRLVLVPAFMSMIGRANWWLPGWLDRILPTIAIEPGEDEVVDDEPEKAATAPA